MFTLGVGVDVNTPLLDRIATVTRAVPTYVLPKEDVELKVAGISNRLRGPVLADPRLDMRNARGGVAMGRVRDLLPNRLPDLFRGDQLVLLGQYVGDAPLHFRVRGNYMGRQRAFDFKFSVQKASTKNAFVPRLWASRKIATLVDAIRDLGANEGVKQNDPRLKELTDEVVRLSTEFGILTEYTAFLAREGTDLTERDRVLVEAAGNFHKRAVRCRYGWGSYNQSANRAFQLEQRMLNPGNGYIDQNMNRVEIATVQQVNDLAFYRRGGRWVDSRVVNQKQAGRPAKEIAFGSEAFRRLAARLARENRQGAISLKGDILISVDNETILIKGPTAK